jgi:predicted metal-dependent enzyme (double-stranded beta helix superfamily)
VGVFDVDDFVARCLVAVAGDEPRRAIKDELERAMSTPGEVADRLRPTEGGITFLHRDDQLTVAHVVWAPGMDLRPHNHNMWAAIGIYAGAEDNEFFRRTGPGEPTIVESGGKRLEVTDVALLGDDTIHAVHNPSSGLTGAIHIYPGDFVNRPRSQWGPGDRTERPHDIDDTYQQFADANGAWRAATAD